MLAAMKTALAEPQIATRKGKPVSVIIPIEAYQELLKRVEDAADICHAWSAADKARVPPFFRLASPPVHGAARAGNPLAPAPRTPISCPTPAACYLAPLVGMIRGYLPELR